MHLRAGVTEDDVKSAAFKLPAVTAQELLQQAQHAAQDDTLSIASSRFADGAGAAIIAFAHFHTRGHAEDAAAALNALLDMGAANPVMTRIRNAAGATASHAAAAMEADVAAVMLCTGFEDVTIEEVSQMSLPRVIRAGDLAAEGLIHGATMALQPSKIADTTRANVQAALLQLHPSAYAPLPPAAAARMTVPTPQNTASVNAQGCPVKVVMLDDDVPVSDFTTSLAGIKKYVAGKVSPTGHGPSGWTYPMMHVIMSRKEASAPLLGGALQILFDSIARNTVPVEVKQRLVASRGIAFHKQAEQADGGYTGSVSLRPLAVEEVWLRVVTAHVASILRAMAKTTRVLSPLDFAIGTSGGAEMPGLLAQTALFADARTVVVSHDVRNAFNTVPRQRIMQVMTHHPALLPIMHLMYAKPSIIDFGDGFTIVSAEGVRQGDGLSSAAFSMALRPELDEVRTRFPTVCVTGYLDDTTAISTSANEAGKATLHYAELLQQLNMQMVPTKCCAYSRTSAAAQATAHGAGIPHAEHGLVVCGTPVGEDNYVNAHLHAAATAAVDICKRIAAITLISVDCGGTHPNDEAEFSADQPNGDTAEQHARPSPATLRHGVQTAFTMLRLCVSSTITHLLRTVPSRLTAAHASRVDAAVIACAAFIISGARTPLLVDTHADTNAEYIRAALGMTIEDATDVMHRLQLPLRHGGMGLTPASSIVDAARMGALALSAHRLHTLLTRICGADYGNAEYVAGAGATSGTTAGAATALKLPRVASVIPDFSAVLKNTMLLRAATTKWNPATDPDFLTKSQPRVQSIVSDLVHGRALATTVKFIKATYGAQPSEVGYRIAQLTSCSGVGAAAWLHASARHKLLRIGNDEWLAAARQRVGAALLSPVELATILEDPLMVVDISCGCEQPDAVTTSMLGDAVRCRHLTTCNGAQMRALRTRRHHAVKHALAHATRARWGKDVCNARTAAKVDANSTTDTTAMNDSGRALSLPAAAIGASVKHHMEVSLDDAGVPRKPGNGGKPRRMADIVLHFGKAARDGHGSADANAPTDHATHVPGTWPTGLTFVDVTVVVPHNQKGHSKVSAAVAQVVADVERINDTQLKLPRGIAAAEAESRKAQLYHGQYIMPVGALQPFGMETMGALGDHAQDVLQMIATGGLKRPATTGASGGDGMTSQQRATHRHVQQRVSVALQRNNGRMALALTNPNDKRLLSREARAVQRKTTTHFNRQKTVGVARNTVLAPHDSDEEEQEDDRDDTGGQGGAEHRDAMRRTPRSVSSVKRGSAGSSSKGSGDNITNNASDTGHQQQRERSHAVRVSDAAARMQEGQLAAATTGVLGDVMHMLHYATALTTTDAQEGVHDYYAGDAAGMQPDGDAAGDADIIVEKTATTPDSHDNNSTTSDFLRPQQQRASSRKLRSMRTHVALEDLLDDKCDMLPPEHEIPTTATHHTRLHADVRGAPSVRATALVSSEASRPPQLPPQAVKSAARLTRATATVTARASIPASVSSASVRGSNGVAAEARRSAAPSAPRQRYPRQRAVGRSEL